MSSRRRAFTLAELLTVIAILAVLFAIVSPALLATRKAVYANIATKGLSQIGMATSIYQADWDDTFPIAMYSIGNGNIQAWFGTQYGKDKFETSTGILSAYMKGRGPKDKTHSAKPYLGDQSGFGYNYGYIGGDFHLTQDYSAFPNCKDAASASSLWNPSQTVTFATSAFYNAEWLPDGDGGVYDFGFIDPPEYWHGVPNVSFRHWEQPVFDSENETMVTNGRAVVLYADGRANTRLRTQMNDQMFRRTTDGY